MICLILVKSRSFTNILILSSSSYYYDYNYYDYDYYDYDYDYDYYYCYYCCQALSIQDNSISKETLLPRGPDR